jgi:uncharacterized membrane protein affecting hemolysin expression
MLKLRLINKFLHLPLAQKAALLCSVLCLCSSIIIILASFQNNRQLIQQSSELFGDSLIKQFAIDASNPLVQGDKLSLQSLLEKMVKSPLIMSGTIYDVANRPLAEAGTEQAKGQSISASITFQDSIAGYAVITLDTKPLEKHSGLLGWELLLLALLLSALAYVLSLLPTRYISTIINDLSAIASIPAAKRSPNTQIQYPGNDEIKTLAKQLINGPNHAGDQNIDQGFHDSRPSIGCAVVSFNLVNIEQLRGQLSPVELQQLLASIGRQLSMISQLYGGEISTNSSSNLSISFKAARDQEQDNYPFRALCSGYLMMLWQQHQPVEVLLQAGLAMDSQLLTVSNTSDINHQLQAQALIEQASSLACLDHQLVVESQLCQHQSVNSCVLTTAIKLPEQEHNSAEAMVVEELSANYEKVLRQQLNALQAELNR